MEKILLPRKPNSDYWHSYQVNRLRSRDYPSLCAIFIYFFNLFQVSVSDGCFTSVVYINWL